MRGDRKASKGSASFEEELPAHTKHEYPSESLLVIASAGVGCDIHFVVVVNIDVLIWVAGCSVLVLVTALEPHVAFIGRAVDLFCIARVDIYFLGICNVSPFICSINFNFMF